MRFFFKILRKIFPFIYTKVIRNFSSNYQTSLNDIIKKNIEFILSNKKKTNLFVDLGVNEGVVLKKFSEHLQNFDLIGFEIQYELISIAKKNNPNSIIHNLAASNKEGILNMYVPKNFGPNFQGGTSIMENKINTTNLKEIRKVKSIRFMTFLEKLRNKYDFICVKMDIEGAEYQIIDDLYLEFKKNKIKLIDYLIVEFHPCLLPNKNDNQTYVYKLQEMGITFCEWN